MFESVHRTVIFGANVRVQTVIGSVHKLAANLYTESLYLVPQCDIIEYVKYILKYMQAFIWCH